VQERLADLEERLQNARRLPAQCEVRLAELVKQAEQAEAQGTTPEDPAVRGAGAAPRWRGATDFQELAAQMWGFQEQDLVMMRKDLRRTNEVLDSLSDEVSATVQRLRTTEASGAALRREVERLLLMAGSDAQTWDGAAGSAYKEAVAVDGRWRNGDGVCTIVGDLLTWPSGRQVHIERLSPSCCSINSLSQAPYKGRLLDSGRLAWDDGDTWIREEPLSAAAPSGAESIPAADLAGGSPFAKARGRLDLLCEEVNGLHLKMHVSGSNTEQATNTTSPLSDTSFSSTPPPRQ
jgi:hypothetical protein